MSDKKLNPIAFNLDTMTVKQLKHCAETLRMLFDGVEREDVSDEDIVLYLKQAREFMLKQWGAAQ